MGRLPDFGGVILFLFVIVAIAGWGSIELILWLFSLVDLSIAKT